MRPLNLTVSAFGPYVREINIELSALGRSGVYLITGDTGAGKTTIFDAICFALYGTASGENRKRQMLRSQYADVNTPTYVKMDFEYRGEVYHIERNPEYERPKTKGEGVTTEKADANLIFPDGCVISGYDKVTAAVCELIGLDERQFSRIAMLAQGDFMKLLNADTKERGEIFRKIFETAPYKKLQEKLGENSRKLQREYDALSRSVLQYVSELVCEESSEWYAPVERLKSADNAQILNEGITVIERMNEADSAKTEQLDKAVEKLDNQLAEVNGRITAAEAYKQAQTRLEANKKLIETLAPELEKADADYKAQLALNPKREALAVEIGKLNEKLADYEALDELTAEGKQLSDLIKSSEAQCLTVRSQIEQGRQTVADIKKALEGLRDVDVELAKLKNESEKANEKLTLLENLTIGVERLNSADADYKRAAETYTQKARAHDTLRADYNVSERLFMDSRAGILAARLEEGKPCCVCGSLEHPSPAKTLADAPSEQELNNAKREVEKSSADLAKFSEQAGKLKGIYDSQRVSLEEMFLNCFGDKTVSVDRVEAAVSETKAAQTDLTKRLRKFEADSQQRKKLDSQLPEVEESIKKLDADNLRISGEIAAMSERRERLRSQYTQMHDKLEYKTKAQALDAINKKLELKQQYDLSLDKARADLDACDRRVRDCRASISADEQLLKSARIDNLDELFETRDKFNKEKAQTNAAANVIRKRLITNTTVLDNINRQREALAQAEQQLKQLDSLSRTANGEIKGKERMLFETYIQINYFNRIILCANRRMKIMSNGQYEFIRAVGPENLRSQSGLELNVIDHYNGSQRSVKSLSGGESFMASLSLALGLSDVIQSAAGGIQLDSMFIDEGFGSLDDDTLEQAMAVLKQLSSGNRIIGIISHVAELKRRIDKQVVVTKDRSGGSKIHIEA